MKKAKLIVREGIPCGLKSFSGKREKARTLDPDEKKYVRAKRKCSHLPDANTDTKWLKKQKSWKYRSKNPKKWMSHFISDWEKVLLDFLEWSDIYNKKKWRKD